MVNYYKIKDAEGLQRSYLEICPILVSYRNIVVDIHDSYNEIDELYNSLQYLITHEIEVDSKGQSKEWSDDYKSSHLIMSQSS